MTFGESPTVVYTKSHCLLSKTASGSIYQETKNVNDPPQALCLDLTEKRGENPYLWSQRNFLDETEVKVNGKNEREKMEEDSEASGGGRIPGRS